MREHVHFLGFVPDEQLPTVYAAADVFTMPGVAELQSIATLEAMASGLPVVAANAVALLQLVIPGENGFLFTSGDIAGLADALRRILISDELRVSMGAASRGIADTHDENRTLSRFEEIYRQVVTRSRICPSVLEIHRPLSAFGVFRRSAAVDAPGAQWSEGVLAPFWPIDKLAGVRRSRWCRSKIIRSRRGVECSGRFD
ncbi:hypothetical protein BAY59_33645 [Prauserella coralliicola]|uniref:Glycosyl transferase family 1 domain-containing protein n=2 Tax=Prauserella TaxID=142577 RepID=A0A318LXU5_9PSEU|nr:hypothetical protein BA062_36790 [Prauserella flavalba]PXY18623.1 hypothetical protein BAY59_33645 [Prauserella coralliicola]TKG63554.1 glycosyltransferase family 4 protein [Prauserella endophytica]